MSKAIAKAVISFIREYELCLDYKLAEKESKYKLKDYDKTLQGYYVYLLINPISNNIFYIGKGKKQRAEQHYKLFLKGKEKNNFKSAEFEKIYKTKMKPIIKIIASDLEEDFAYKVETKLIKRLYKNITNISWNENEPNLLKRELRKILKTMPTYEEWISGIYYQNPILFEILKTKNYGYEIYNIASNTIKNLAKENGLWQTTII